MDGWWLDSTEPDHLEIQDKDFDTKTYLGSFRRVHNAFPLMSNKGVYEHQRATTSDKRVFLLTRSSFLDSSVMLHIHGVEMSFLLGK